MRISNDRLRTLCIENDWFACGDNEQYEKLFSENRKGASNERLALIIWICSENCSEIEIRATLDEACGINETPIEVLKLCVRAENALKRSDIYTIKELVKRTEAQIMKVRSIGIGGINEIKKALSERGLSLAGDEEDYSEIPL